MAERDEVLARLRAATASEIAALGKILSVTLGEDAEVNAVHLADAFHTAAAEKVYRTTLATVATVVAGRVDWPLERVADTAEVEWIEDYVYQALAFLHRPDRAALSDHDKAKERERAEHALQGMLPSPLKQTESALVGAGAIVLGYVFGLWFVVPVLALGALALLFGPSMKKVVPATLLLIHIRKRLEFEKVLREPA